MCASSIAHAYNLNGFVTALLADCSFGLVANPNELSTFLCNHPTNKSTIFATPRMIGGVTKRVPVGAVGRMFSAGCPLRKNAWSKACDIFGTNVMQNYGTSETGNIALETDARVDGFVEGCVGKPWGSVSIVEAAGGILPPPSPALGEVRVVTPWASSGYVIDGAHVPHNEHGFMTGDVGAIDEHGELRLTGRLSRLLCVNNSGLTVMLHRVEVENAIRCAPGVHDVAAVQLGPNALGVAYSGTISTTELREWMNDDSVLSLVRHLQHFDELPSSPAGKILIPEVMERFVWL